MARLSILANLNMVTDSFRRFQGWSRTWRPRYFGAIKLWIRYTMYPDQQIRDSKLRVKLPVTGLFATVISLPHRVDRRIVLSDHLTKLGIEYKFFDALADNLPLVGCAESHAQVLSNWDVEKADWLTVFEDDIQFHTSLHRLFAIIGEFLENPALDVLCLANNSYGKKVKISGQLSITQHTQTTAAYVVKARARQRLVTTFLDSSQHLKNGKPASEYALDIMWTRLQRRNLIFAIPNDLVASQRPSFSDIEKEFVNYGV